MSSNFYDLLKYANTGIASPEMTHYDKMRALATAGGGKVETLTGVPPLSFRANGKPLISLSMIGNGRQTGTPSPQSIIMPEFVGVRTGNLFPQNSFSGKTHNIQNQFNNAASGVVFNTGQYVFTVKISTELTSGVFKFCYTYTDDSQEKSNWITRFTSSVTLVSNANKTIKSISITDYNSYGDITLSEIMLNTGSAAHPYEPYGWKIPISCGGTTTPLYLGQTQTVRRVRKLVLTSDTGVTWNKSATRNYSWYFFPSEIGAPANTSFYCTHGATVTSVTDFVYGTVYCDNTVNIGIFPSSLATLSMLKSWLDEQYANGTPVTIWYVLAEPETGIINEPLTKIGYHADELHVGSEVTIPTAKGQNTLTVDTDLPPSEMTITYTR